MTDKKSVTPETAKVTIRESYTPKTTIPAYEEKGTYTAQTAAPKTPPPPKK